MLASRGSVIPLFHEQIKAGGPVTITDPRMTRFLLSLEDAVDIIYARGAHRPPRRNLYSARSYRAMIDVATALIDGRPIKTVVTGIRPGEKLHELLISEEECFRAFARGDYYVVAPILPELRDRARKRHSSSANTAATPT